MSLATLTPLILSLAVPDPAQLNTPVLAADHCVSAITTGKVDDSALLAGGWTLDSKTGKDGSADESRVYFNAARSAGIVIDRKSPGGKPRCLVLYPASEQGQNVTEFQLAAHFNGRVFPITAETTGFEIPGHKVAIFSTRKTVKDRPVLEIMVTIFEPKGGTK